jgi:uncharacterized hydrophobic protein (TIGR00271 family)
VIATYGVLSDSTATVIGAMIVAPLMGPIMATAAAVIMGSTGRAGRALGLVGVGVLTVIAFSYVLTLIVPSVIISFTNNTEITSRVNPGLLALLTALASGAAGAFIVAREEISDSMGGVAVAISLVPPLGQWGAAEGALLLFITNFVAILLAGGVMLWVSGLNEIGEAGARHGTRRSGFALIVVVTLLVAIPLTLTAGKVLLDARDTITARTATLAWLNGTTFDLVSLTVNGNTVGAVVAGSAEPPNPQALATQLANALGRPVVVDLHIVNASDLTVPGRPGSN